MKEHEHFVDSLARVPEELKRYRQWVNWRRVDDRKVPVNPSTLGNAGIRWKTTWAPFDQVVANAAHFELGTGFVLTGDDPYSCVDLDRCVEPEGQVTAQTRAILDLLSGWVELSPSGMGLHIWVRNERPVNRKSPGIEVYSNARWMTVTGRSNPHAPQEIPNRTSELEELVSIYFRTDMDTTTIVARTLEDEAIWEYLFNSRQGGLYQNLYQGDTSGCYDDHSRAVILLANQLARVTDLDANRIKRLLYQTGLVRPKWEERRGESTWIDHQILNAIRFVARRG